jgi:nitric-oxide synthase
LGGLIYSAAPFNGWFMGTEISRNLLDTQRYNVGPAMAKALGFSMKNSSLWRDEVQLVLNKAILASFMREGTSVIDHHSASDSFMEFMETQIEEVGWCPADWIWITPPAGGSMTKVFHQEMINWCSKPAYREQSMAWVEGKARIGFSADDLRDICVDFDLDTEFIPNRKTATRSVLAKTASLLANKIHHTFILYGSETGTCSSIARKLRSALRKDKDSLTMQ